MNNKKILSSIIVMGTLMFSTLAFAEGNTENPLYAPNKSSFYSKTDVGGVQIYPDGVGAQDYPMYRAEEEFGYGVLDNLSVRLNAEYNDDTDGSRDRSGFTNPSIGATYRVIDQKTNGVTVDVLGDAHFSVEEADTDNVSDSRHSLEAAVRVGKDVMPNLTVAGLVGTEYHLEGDNNVAGVDVDDSTDAKVSLMTQYRFDPKLSANVELTHEYIGEVGATDDYNTTDLTLQGNYQAMDNLLLSAYAGYGLGSEDFIDQYAMYGVKLGLEF